MQSGALEHFSAPARSWFGRSFQAPTPAQEAAWSSIRSGDSTLVVAPTGSGKTLAAFFWALDVLAARPVEAEPPKSSTVLYVSPLKALAVDVERNLRAPLTGLRQEMARAGLADPNITVAVRSGDTPAAERRRQARTPPDILITTPESLYLLLTSAARDGLRGVRTVIIDEIHSVAGSKRGAHLALSLERLEALTQAPVQRIGLSATVRPAAEVARFLGGGRPVAVIEPGSDKEIDVRIEVPVEDMADLGGSTAIETFEGSAAAEAPGNSIWPHVEQRVLDLITAHTATLVFVNSRRLAERLTSRLNELALEREAEPPPDQPQVEYLPDFTSDGSHRNPPVVARAHHGSVSKEQRASIEEDLKSGRLPAVVATSSLELGIDMGAVDLVIQVEAPPSAAAGLQRIGRAGHQVGAVSRGSILPKYRADLMAATVVARLMRQRRIEALRVPENPLDVLAQQVVAAVAVDDWHVDELFDLVRKAAPYARLPESAWIATLDMLSGKYPADNFADLRPKLVWDRVSGMLTARPGAQRLAVTSGGTIPDRGLFSVHLVGEKSSRLGELDEEMVYESRVGDVFALGANSWRIEDITHDRVVVSPAPGQPGKMPFWHGDALGRSLELGRQIGDSVRTLSSLSPEEATATLVEDGLDENAVTNLLAYLAEQEQATGRVPSDRTIVVERFRDELGDWQVALLSPLGARVHAPWALAIGARLRLSTGIDVQVMHADDGIVLRIPDSAAEDIWSQVREAILIDPDEIADLVTSEIGGSALFGARFRECAARALLLPKRDPGRRAPLWQQRQRSSQLLSVAAAHPTFPIVLEAVRECVSDVYDVPGLREVLASLHNGATRLHEVVSDQPSPFARALLFGYVAAFMYEGDSPLAERKAAALTLDVNLLADLLGTTELRDLLDAEAVAEIEAEVGWLDPDRTLRDSEDLADALRVLGPLSDDDIRRRGGDPQWASALVGTRRALRVSMGVERTAAIEDAGRLRHALGVPLPVGIPLAFTEPTPDPLGDLVARYARTHGPFSAAEVATHFGIGSAVATGALARLADTGTVLSGEFRPGRSGSEWCDAEVLRRIRRRSIAKLRSQAEPVPARTYADFLAEWHGIGGKDRGVDAVLRAVEQLAGVPLPASALETQILPNRVRDYAPGMLDELTAAGEVTWCGAGSLPGGDGWLMLAADHADILLGEPEQVEGFHVEQLLAALGDGGGWFYPQLLERISATAPEGFDPAGLPEALEELLWAGWLTNDTLAPVRARVDRKGRRRSRGRRRTGRVRTFPTRSAVGNLRRPEAARVPPTLAGRWSAVRRSTMDPTARAVALAPWLLERHAVVTRGSMSIERYQGGFAAAYKVLRAMEDRGNCIRTHAIEGLGAAQFTTAAVVDRLRAAADQERRATEAGSAPTTAVLLAATDPAQPYGAALPWPVRNPGDGGHRPGRKAGAVVVLSRGELVLYLERGGRTMLTWTDDAGVLESAATALARAVRDGLLGDLTVQRSDGDSALTSPAAQIFGQAGFALTPTGLRMRAG
ncbi:MAG: ATP-dependent helicase [Actinobacteria bacterium]|nr:ATP-dependent helicase [Actinomycetota bacterium]